MSCGQECKRQGFALIFALIIIILIAGFGASYLTVSTSSLRLVSATRSSAQALYVAETGLAHAVHELNVSNMSAFKDGRGNPAPATGPYSGIYTLTGTFAIKNDNNQDMPVGDFEVELVVLETDPAIGQAPSAVTLKCTGDYGGVARTVEANFVYASLVNTAQAIVTERDLTIRGNVTVRGNIHTNGTLILAGRSAQILPADPGLSNLGDPPYLGAFDGNLSAHRGIVGAADVAGTQDGNSAAETVPHITPDMVTAKARGLGWEIEEISVDSSRSARWMRWARIDSTDLTCPGGVPGKLVLVNGDAMLSGQASGNVIMAATGDIWITGSTGHSGRGGVGHVMMVVSGGNITIAGNTKVDAVLMANGSITARGNATINGGIIAANGPSGPMNRVAGSLTVNYVRPSAAVENFFRRWGLITWRRTSPGGRQH